MRSRNEVTWPQYYDCLPSRHKLRWACNLSMPFGIWFMEWVKKPSAYRIKKWGGKTRFLSIMLLSPRDTMKKIRNRLIKNLLIQWEYWGGKPKDPWGVIGEKSPNLQIGYFLEGKPRENQTGERFRTFLLAWWWWWIQQVDHVSLLEPLWAQPLVEQ